MSDPNQPTMTFQQRYMQLRDTVERLPEHRPTVDNIDAIIEWLVGPARQVETLATFFDEFSWRMLATGLPLLRTTIHGATLHPLYLGATAVWWRNIGQTQLMLISHDIRESTAFQ